VTDWPREIDWGHAVGSIQPSEGKLDGSLHVRAGGRRVVSCAVRGETVAEVIRMLVEDLQRSHLTEKRSYDFKRKCLEAIQESIVSAVEELREIEDDMGEGNNEGRLGEGDLREDDPGAEGPPG
tara:strand:- start:6325 stop:6696 length:372 start_codon:yes stop_codon:yes gene_type:complete